MFSASVRSLSFLSFIMSIFAQKFPLISPVFLNRSLVFPFQLFSSTVFLCTVHLTKPSCLSLLFFGSPHSIFCNFPYLPCICVKYGPKTLHGVCSKVIVLTGINTLVGSNSFSITIGSMAEYFLWGLHPPRLPSMRLPPKNISLSLIHI